LPKAVADAQAISRLILAATFDKFPNLKILLAHSGGAIPFLAGRLDSCVAHDRTVQTRLKHEPTWYLKKLYYDGVGYHSPALKLARELVGAGRIMFGYIHQSWNVRNNRTDNPFFPPLTGDPNEMEWDSVRTNVEAAKATFTENELVGVMGRNAIEILALD
jgi:aminocarboxymuconate-semialdehyde decarboxylase